MKKIKKINWTEVYNEIENKKVNKIICSPFFIKLLSKYIIDESKAPLKLDQIHTGGAVVFPDEAKILKEVFPTTTVVYGSTECEPISSISINELSEQIDTGEGICVGEIFEDTQLKVINISNTNIDIDNIHQLNELTCKEGDVGEIIVAGAHVLKTYFKNPEAFKRNKIKLNNGEIWHRTGDSGFIRNNLLFLSGKCDQLFIHDNILYSPFVWENNLRQINGVNNATILYIENKIVVVVEGENNVKIEAEICIDKNVSNVIFIRKIPMDPRHASKIDYKKLTLMIKNNKKLNTYN